MMILFKTLLPLILILLSSSCINLSKQQTKARFFQLPGTTPASLSPSEKPNLTLGITRVEIASYLQKKKIAYRQSPTEIRYHQNAYWAEALDKSIQRHCRNQLSLLLPTCNTVSAPWDLPQKPDYLLSLKIDQFEVTPDKRGVIRGDWVLFDNAKGEVIQRQSFNQKISIEGDDIGQEIEALSSHLDVLLQNIADWFMTH